MLEIYIEGEEAYDEETQSFVTLKPTKLRLEHSLLSISKWESYWQKPFFKKGKTPSETMDYVRLMSIDKNVPPEVFGRLTSEQTKIISDYINAPMSAVKFREDKTPAKMQTTSETIYYQMIALQIPFECEKWHLNRLLTFIRYCAEKQGKPKKRSRGEILRSNAEINRQRRQQYNTKG